MTNFLRILVCICLFCNYASGQITLNAGDLPFNDDTYHVFSLKDNFPPNPTPGPNQTWDYRNFSSQDHQSWNFNIEELEFFKSAGVDGYFSTTKGFNTSFFWAYDVEYDFNPNGIFDIGMYIPEQRYGLGQISGNPTDSLIIPLQGYLFSVPRVMMTFPATFGSSWQSTGRRFMDFILHVPAFGLNQTPARHAYTFVRQDTIVGYGKMRVYTPNGPSQEYDVLMHRSSNYTLDSFYLNGQPAPAPILNAFGVAQGQKTDQVYQYNFYRKNAPGYVYLARAVYNNANFTSIKNFWVNTDNVLVSSTNDKTETYSTLVFPNPATPNAHLNIITDRFNKGEVDFSIYHTSGQYISSGSIVSSGNPHFSIDISNISQSGTYMIVLKDREGKTLTENFIVEAANR